MLFNLQTIVEAVEQQVGFCIACGEPHECCEPDAKNYHCAACGQYKVYGAEEIIVMGLIDEEDLK